MNDLKLKEEFTLLAATAYAIEELLSERSDEEADALREVARDALAALSRVESRLAHLEEGLRRGVAIALVLGQWEGAIADRVGQETWDALYAEGMLRQASRYPGGEPEPLLTGEAMEFLRSLLAE